MMRLKLALLAAAITLAACDRRPTGPRESVGAAATRGDSPSAPATQPATATSSATAEPAQPPAADDLDDERLYGTWVARDVDVSMGEVEIQLTFRREGNVRILAWSDLPFVGQVRNKRASYEVSGNTISSQALRGGTLVNYRFDGQDLIIEYKEGKTVRFKRQS